MGKMCCSGERFYVISLNIEDLTDILSRLKGFYDNYEDLGDMVAYKCSKFGNIEVFRDSMQGKLDKV
jgi:hypothetical protein